MDKDVEARMKVGLLQLANETTIFERLIYKNKNQHRRALYFRRLCQVRRDLRLLHSAGLSELVSTSGTILALDAAHQSSNGEQILKDCEELRRRLFGAAKLLEQMSDPILCASSLVAGLLGQTFFMPFALTAFACLARFRVLVLQILQDIVSIFNKVSDLEFCKIRKLNIFKEPSQSKKSGGAQLSKPIPDQIDCKWDDVKFLIMAKSIRHQQEIRRDESDVMKWFMEDRKKRMYAIFGSELSDHEEPEDVCAVSTSAEPMSRCKLLETEVTDGSDTLAHENISGSLNSIDNAGSGHLVCSVKERDNPTKKVAYISVTMDTDKSATVEKATIPLPAKDPMFDMLLGLG